MPSTSQAQHAAMAAACHGESTRGIPKSVGCDYIAADRGKDTSALPKKKRTERQGLRRISAK